MSTAVESNPMCKYCGVGWHGIEACPRVAEIEYEWSGSFIKRVRFHVPQPVVTATMKDWPTYPPIEPGPSYRTMAQEHEAMKQALRQIARMMRNNPASGDPVETARAKLNYLGIGWE